ncbi:MAG: STAS domain-containing protein [Planctomycetota bacterium]|nr:STAS domain-containing protein [Planctomycetota bacterium]
MSGSTDQSLPHAELPLIEQGVDYDARYSWRLEQRDRFVVLTVAGRVSKAPSIPFSEKADAVLNTEKPQRLMVDFSACEHISSGALGYLVRFFRTSASFGGQVLGVAPNDHVRGLMNVLGMDAFLFTVTSWDMAERFFAAQEPEA